MLFYSQDPPGEGAALTLGSAPAPLQPPEYHRTLPEEYRACLRAAYRRDPRPFLALAQRGAAERLTLYSPARPDLVAVLYEIIVGIAQTRGRAIAGGALAARPKSTTGRYVPASF